MKALVAMSGGVDSSVAAALMLEQGHDVVGVTLKQWQGADGSMPTSGCCTVADAEDARRVAAQLDVPYYVLDHVADFRERVVEPFGAAYVAGRTPNPCIDCNRRVRFRTLLERTEALGCDFLVTGHYARVKNEGGSYKLLKGKDPSKDQSYVLHMLGQAELSQVRLPIGEFTKPEVRAEAERLGLRTAAKPDSQDICFVKDDYRSFLRENFSDVAQPGQLVDTGGKVLGEHEGTVDFTIGQRKGLGVALGEPRYVVDIQPSTATVVIGKKADLEALGCTLEEVSFVSGGVPPQGTEVDVKIRYRSAPVPAVVSSIPTGVELMFRDPQLAVAPGQAAVMYAGDEVVGGGTIATVVKGDRVTE
ncbi:MAG: tRNA 2-thiouridine(34) synthase MnmA [Acidimicrobiia bacterium]|nr:tRNA 2-thiouridine(34) synthase MnmA [Acidimicrobiia bacterium]